MTSIALTAALLSFAAIAHANYRELTDIPPDPFLQTALRHTAERTLKQFPKLKDEDLALSVVDVSRPSAMGRGDYHGDAPFYPASVVKLFYMVEIYHQGKLDPEINRALGEMIRVSDNDATAFLVDVLSDTCAGPNLEGRALAKFIERRRVVNRYFASMGYDISAMAKPWSFGPFGRELQLLGPNRENRNRASANAIAAVLLWIARRRAVSEQASDAMLALLARPLNPPRADENQVKEFLGAALPPDAKLWSKAGWTSEVRHDAAYVELPDGKKYVIVVMTRGVADDVTLLPAIGKILLEELH